MRFADTSYWIALQANRDRDHLAAAALWRRDQHPVRTSTAVLGETWTWLRRRVGHMVAERAVNDIRRSARVSVTLVDEPVDQRAWEWLHRHDERAYSYVDATSFEIMRRERITEALAFDGDFSAAGFIELRP